jgi:predicted nucleic acid-binding protein
MILCDTNVMIRVFALYEDTLEAVEKIGYDNVVLSEITVMELYRGTFNKAELLRMHRRATAYPAIPITNTTSRLATELVLQFHLSHGLQIPDALIAATAVTYRLPLFTYNLKDFRHIPGLLLHTPDEE